MSDFDAFAKSMSAHSEQALADTQAGQARARDAKQEKLDALTFSPAQISSQSMQLLEERSKAKTAGADTGIKTLDAWMLPMRPGELIGVLGFTSNGKSSLLSYIARHNANRIRQEQRPNHIVLSVTWEQAVEEQGVVDIAQIAGVNATDLMRGTQGIDDAVLRATVTRSKMPWWWIGHSVLDPERRPRINMDQLNQVIDRLVTRERLKLDLIVLDYLQRIPGKANIRERRERFVDVVDDSKDLALAWGVPVMLGSQAGRQIKDRSWQMPLVDDAQETSNFEQSCDKMLACHYPRTAYPMGSQINDGTKDFTVTDNLFFVSILKQKFGPSNIQVELYLDPARNIISPVERIGLNDY